MRWGVFARPRGRHAAGAAPVRVEVKPHSGAQPPVQLCSGVQLTFADGSSLDLPESSPYTLAMRATAAVLVSPRYSTEGIRRR